MLKIHMIALAVFVDLDLVRILSSVIHSLNSSELSARAKTALVQDWFSALSRRSVVRKCGTARSHNTCHGASIRRRVAQRLHWG